MRRLTTVAVTVAALSLGSLTAAAASPTSTLATGVKSAAPAASAKVTRTRFSFSGAAFGTRVEGGDVPADSTDTAFNALSCTNRAGLMRRNTEADAMVPGLGQVQAVETRVWSEQTRGATSTYATHRIARIVIAESGLGRLVIRGLTSRSRAFFENGRFQAQVTSSIGALVFTPPVGPSQNLDLPTPGNPVRIPDLATLTIGKKVQETTARSAVARGNVLDITVIPTDTRARVGQTRAELGRGVTQGIFSGFSSALQADALDDNLKIGRTPLTLMPCSGTEGEPEVRGIAELNIDDQLVAEGLASGQRTRTSRSSASGTEVGRVARIALADGALEIGGVLGVVNVRREGSRLTSNTNGTTVGEIVANGETVALPDSEPLEIPGLARIEGNLSIPLRNGRKVVALRVTLLDGTGATIDLGVAQLAIKPSGVRRR